MNESNVEEMTLIDVAIARYLATNPEFDKEK